MTGLVRDNWNLKYVWGNRVSWGCETFGNQVRKDDSYEVAERYLQDGAVKDSLCLWGGQLCYSESGNTKATNFRGPRSGGIVVWWAWLRKLKADKMWEGAQAHSSTKKIWDGDVLWEEEQSILRKVGSRVWRKLDWSLSIGIYLRMFTRKCHPNPNLF